MCVCAPPLEVLDLLMPLNASRTKQNTAKKEATAIGKSMERPYRKTSHFLVFAQHMSRGPGRTTAWASGRARSSSKSGHGVGTSDASELSTLGGGGGGACQSLHQPLSGQEASPQRSGDTGGS